MPRTPITDKQRRRRRIGVALILIAGICFGIWEALDCARIPFGYVASYDFGIAFFLTVCASVLGMLLLIYWRTRSSGMALIVAGIISYATFLGGIYGLKKLDRVAWQHEPPMQRFGPDQQASIVIYYRHGTSQAEINDFIDKVLERPAQPRHDGRDFPEFVSEYMVLIPSQASGYDGSTIGLRSNAAQSETAAYIASIRADPRVARIFLNSAPDSIHLPSDSPTAAPARHKAPHTP